MSVFGNGGEQLLFELVSHGWQGDQGRPFDFFELLAPAVMAATHRRIIMFLQRLPDGSVELGQAVVSAGSDLHIDTRVNQSHGVFYQRLVPRPVGPGGEEGGAIVAGHSPTG